MKKIIYFCIDWTSPQYLAHASSYHKRLSSVLQAHCIKKDLLLCSLFLLVKTKAKLKYAELTLKTTSKHLRTANTAIAMHRSEAGGGSVLTAQTTIISKTHHSSHYNQIHFSLCLIGTSKYSPFTSAHMKELL